MKCQIKITICVKAVCVWWMVTQMMFDVATGRNTEWKVEAERRVKRRLYSTACLVWKLFSLPFVLCFSLFLPLFLIAALFIFRKLYLSDPTACGVYSFAFCTTLQNVPLCCITGTHAFFTFILWTGKMKCINFFVMFILCSLFEDNIEFNRPKLIK